MKDNYGNEINYDINAWVGEDNISNSFISDEHSVDDTNSFGRIHITLNNIKTINNNSNILISLINDKLEKNDLYLNNLNNYIKDYDLKVGSYDILIVKDINSNEEFNTNITSFQIKQNENINILVIPKEQIITEINEEIVETISRNKIETNSVNSIISVFIIFLIFAMLFLISSIIIKLKFRGQK